MLGFSGSGKTLMLASMYHYFAHGGPAGIRFWTDNASNGMLVQLAQQIRDTPDGGFPSSTRIAETRNWSFTVRVESGTDEADAFTLDYLDYAGRYAEGLIGVETEDPPDLEFNSAVASADVLMGVMDGAKLRRLMADGYDKDTVGELERLLNVLIRASQRNIHLVISKWDMMRSGQGGAYYTITDVIDMLDNISVAFRNFRKNPRLGEMRIIPVSALGINGFVQLEPDGTMSRKPGVPWKPWNEEIPFFCAIPDIIRYDVGMITARAADPPAQGKQGYGDTIAKITLAVLTVVGMTSSLTVHGVVFTFPVNEAIKRIKKYVGEKHERGKVPEHLNETAAISYMLNECYAAAGEFEQHFPDSRIERKTTK
jgi:hypothetical protein